MQYSSNYFMSGDIKLHYLSWGNESGRPIVLLHGLRAYAQTWASLAETLGEGYRVYALDQRGRGNSDWCPNKQYCTETYVADLLNFVHHLNLNKFDLLGHSLGGANALEFARQYPAYLDRLIVEDIGPGSSLRGDGAERIKREMKSTPMIFEDWRAAREFWESSRPGLNSDALNSRLTFSMRETTAGKVTWKHDQEGIAEARLNIRPTDLWPAVENLRCKNLFIRGGDSDFLPRETLSEMQARNPNIAWMEISDASHYVHDDQAQKFNDVVKEFLNK